MTFIEKLKLAGLARAAAGILTPANIAAFFKSKTCWSLTLSLLAAFAHSVWQILAPALPGLVADGLRAAQGVIPPEYQPVAAKLFALGLFLVGVWGRVKPTQQFGADKAPAATGYLGEEL